ncbi:glycoside hydrolase superfamily [Mrakia frigida]|uniref:beta-glucosidase n=1 Tax=Mrakia frigida TaxID=29902 RepID=UPI003FCBFC4D
MLHLLGAVALVAIVSTSPEVAAFPLSLSSFAASANRLVARADAVYSPPVYPTPETRATGDWTVAVNKAKAELSTWTLAERAALATGDLWQPPGLCVGNVKPIASTGFPGLCLQDAPVGVRVADLVSAFPSGVNVAATFDRTLMFSRGLAMGNEFKGKGVNIALGPGMNPARTAEGGRNWEGFGADPYLQGEAAYQTITGMQASGVQATAKHFIGNEEEHLRIESSSNIDDRTLHEIYLHPFLRSVQANVANVMTAYNQINGSWAAQNSKLNNGILKGELGFSGTVMSDWAGARSGLASALGGLDMNMPGVPNWLTFDGTSYWGVDNLLKMVSNGSMPESRVTDMATRILSSWYLLGQDVDFPATNFNGWDLTDEATNQHVNVQDDHYKLIRQMGSSATVLLKNTNNALPLKNPKSLLVIGDDAFPSSKNGDPNFYTYRGGNDGTLAVGWGSGANDFPYLVDPLSAIIARSASLKTNVTSSRNNFDLAAAGALAGGKDAALVFINSNSGEAVSIVDGNDGDRNNISAWGGGDQLVLAVAAKNKNTIVIVHSVGVMDTELWIDHPNVTAVVWAGLPGQESGNSCADVLFGDVNPSGRLPYTIAKDQSHYVHATPLSNTESHPQVTYSEKLNVDYRHFAANNLKPRFPFGFGLSYTKFSYSGLSIKTLSLTSAQTTDLHAPKYTVNFTVQNCGSVSGEDVPQLYLTFPSSASEPPRVLRGFTKVSLAAGKSVSVSLALSTYDLSIWDVVKQKWVKPSGTFKVVVATDALAAASLSGSI